MYFLIISISLLFNYFFSLKLKKRFGEFRYIEIGFLLNFFLSLYIIFPTIIFITSSFTIGDPISYVLNGFAYSNEILLQYHLMRMLLFQFIFILAYLKIRNTKIITLNNFNFKFKKTFLILFLFIVLISYFLLFALSGDFDGYLESYQRYDHHSRPLRLFISIIVRFKFAFIILFLIHFFIYFKNKKWILFGGFTFLLFLESKYSAGARISVLFILFIGFALYVILKGLPKIRNLIFGLFISIIAFSIVEKTRISDDNSLAENELSQLIPGEFGSAFLSSYHLYQKREDDQLPETNYKMFFFDFIAPFFPNADITNIDPIFWYKENYFPEAEVPPFTIGPIANTAIWEGEIGLLLRSWLCALLFAKFLNSITKKSITPFYLFIYLSVFSTSVMVVKYSIFYQLTMIFKNLFLPFIFYSLLNYFYSYYKKKKILKNNEINLR
jgi:hypothetical protein